MTIAVIDGHGLVTVVGAGDAIITVRTEIGGFSDTILIYAPEGGDADSGNTPTEPGEDPGKHLGNTPTEPEEAKCQKRRKKCIPGVYAKVKVKAPKKKASAYKKLLKSKGMGTKFKM